MIPPGKEGRVSLTVDTGTLKGRQTKGISVFSNDPDWSELRLLLTATVKTIIDVTPAEYAYMRIGVNQQWNHTFKLISTENQSFQITKIVIPGGKFSVTQSKIQENRNRKFGYEITVSAIGKMPIGPVQERIEIHTDLPGASKVDIRIFGKVEGSISYYPERLTFYPNNNVMNGQFSATVDIATTGKELFIRKIENLAPGIKWDVIPVEDERRYVLVFVWMERQIKKRLYGEAVIITDDEAMPTITIPYEVYPSER